MKSANVKSQEHALPDTRTVCEIIMRLSSPVHVMGWLMAETGCRLTDLLKIRVSDFSAGRKTISICSKQGRCYAEISTGLQTAIGDYLHQLRETFERYHRGRANFGMKRLQPSLMFSDQLLFPVWSIPGCETCRIDQVFPSARFVDELQEAAFSVGYTGSIHSNTLRLFCASRWVKEGLDLSAIHERLGHKDVLTTMLMVQSMRSEGLSFIPDQPEFCIPVMAGAA